MFQESQDHNTTIRAGRVELVTPDGRVWASIGTEPQEDGAVLGLLSFFDEAGTSLIRLGLYDGHPALWMDDQTRQNSVYVAAYPGGSAVCVDAPGDGGGIHMAHVKDRDPELLLFDRAGNQIADLAKERPKAEGTPIQLAGTPIRLAHYPGLAAPRIWSPLLSGVDEADPPELQMDLAQDWARLPELVRRAEERLCRNEEAPAASPAPSPPEASETVGDLLPRKRPKAPRKAAKPARAQA